MKYRAIIKFLVIVIIILLGYIGYMRYNSIKSFSPIEKEEDVSFDSEFYDRVTTQNLEMQNLLVLADSQYLSAPTKNVFQKYQPFTNSLKNKSKNCVALKDKRRFKIELGQLAIRIKDGQPVDIKGLKISRENADNLLSQIFVYDKAIVNICLQLEKINPQSSEDRKFILDLLDKQQAIVTSYEKFKLQISQSQSEDDVVKAVTINKQNVDSLNIKPKVDSLNKKPIDDSTN